MIRSSPALLAQFLQLPQDPTSGAARSMRTICEFLAAAGWRVHALGTTSTEGPLGLTAGEWLRRAGVAIDETAGILGSRLIAFEAGGVRYSLVDFPEGAAPQDKRAIWEAVLDGIRLQSRPNVFLTYSASRSELDLRRRLREAGMKVIFSPRNEQYQALEAFEQVDAAFASTAYLREVYRRKLAAGIEVLPLPVAAKDVTAPVREPAFLTLVNPIWAKGAAMAARIFDEIASRHSGLPILVVNSRGDGDAFVRIGLDAGVDLRRHSNILLAAATAEPWRIYAVTKVVLMPSIVEAAGRVAVEAMMNGIPVVASDRGGLPEILAGGGFTLPLGEGTTPSAENLARWVELTVRLMSDMDFYREASAKALYAAQRYDEPALVRAYASFFERVAFG